jgi:hypothetical protein
MIILITFGFLKDLAKSNKLQAASDKQRSGKLGYWEPRTGNRELVGHWKLETRNWKLLSMSMLMHRGPAGRRPTAESREPNDHLDLRFGYTGFGISKIG